MKTVVIWPVPKVDKTLVASTPTSKSSEQLLREFVNYVIDNDLSNTLEAAVHQFIEEEL